MADDAAPVLTNPGSRVMYPVEASNFPSSIPGAPSTGWTTLSCCSAVGKRRATVSVPDDASDMDVPLTFVRAGGACRFHRQPYVQASRPWPRCTPPRWGSNSPLYASRERGFRAAAELPGVSALGQD